MRRPNLYAAVLWLVPFRFLSLCQANATLSPSYLTIPEPLPEDSPRICPLPRCERCPTVEQIQAPGVGFALEMGYGYNSLFLSPESVD